MAFVRTAVRLRAGPPKHIQHSFLDSSMRACKLNPIGKEGRSSRKGFRGTVRAVILDWAGCTVDAHCLAPAAVFCEVFEKHGVPITMQEAREPMGLRKDMHIAKILENPDVLDRWHQLKGYEPTPIDVNMLFSDFVPMQLSVLPRYSTVLPRVVETVNRLRANKNVKIGSTTGYTKAMMDILLRDAAKQGYEPDCSVAGDEVPNGMGGRPAPFMVYQNLVNLGVYPIESVIKVDDTVAGVLEGLNAGCWSVGIANWGNYTDVDSIAQWESMTEDEKEARREKSRAKLYTSGAHYVIDEMVDLLEVVQDINERLSRGDMPYMSS